MRFAVHIPRQIRMILAAMAFTTLVAVLMSDCPSLGKNQAPVTISGFEEEVPNLMKISEGVYAGGQPTTAGVWKLKELGIKSIINLRPLEESGARDMTSEAKELDMNYFHIPLTPATFSYQKIEELHQLIEDKNNYPLFIHCRSGNRSAGAWFLHRVLFKKADKAEALSEARKLGLEPGLERRLLDFLNQLEKGAVK